MKKEKQVKNKIINFDTNKNDLDDERNVYNINI